MRDECQPLRNRNTKLGWYCRSECCSYFHKEFGFAEMEKRVLEHTSYIISRFKAQGVKVLTPDIASERSGIVSVEIEKPQEVLERLLKKNIIVAVRSGKLRLSPHFYNTEEELRTAMNAIFE